MRVSGNTMRNAEHGVRCDVGQIDTAFSRNRLTGVAQPGSGCLSPVDRVGTPGPLARRGGTVVLVRGGGFGADLAAFPGGELTATINGRPRPARLVQPHHGADDGAAGAAGAAATLRLLRGGITVGIESAGSYAAS